MLTYAQELGFDNVAALQGGIVNYGQVHPVYLLY
jgi:predicted sulfurtransferase